MNLFDKNSKFPLFLLILNTIGSYIWIFGMHSLRLYFLSISGILLFILFFLYKSPNSVSLFKFWIVILFFIGIQNIQDDYMPILVVDICSFGIISSGFYIRNFSIRQLKGIGMFLFIIPITYYIYTIPLLNLDLLKIGNFERDMAVSSISQEILTGGASKSYVIYMTQQLFTLYLNLFLLLMPIYYKFFKRKTIVIMILISVFLIVLIASYYQKRQGITELLLIILLYLIFYKSCLKGLLTKKVISSLVLVSFVIMGFFSFTFIEGLINRFQDLAVNIKEFDRFEETKLVLSNFSVIDMIFGKGLGSFAMNTAGFSILHIGYSNFILKGGLVLVSIYLYNTFANIKYCFRRSKVNPIFNVGVAISLFSLIQLTYTSGYNFYAPVILTGLAMFSRFPLMYLYDSKSLINS